MYFWNTAQLADDIKNNKVSDSDWKNYYLAGSIYWLFIMAIVELSPAAEESIFIFVILKIITVVITALGINFTFKTNQMNGGANYVARILALSFPIVMKLFVLAMGMGMMLVIIQDLFPTNFEFLKWLMLAFFSIATDILYFWRLHVHLKFINS